MYHIAIIEDDPEYSAQIQAFLAQYQEENSTRCKISVFEDGLKILNPYQQIYDLILLDIELPGMNGMDVAEQIRRADRDVVLMFITNIASYAIRGYEVGALDYVMKPLTYYSFSMRLTRALKRIRQKQERQILLQLADGIKRVGIHQIHYVEVQNRMLYYHTDEGEYVVRGTLQSAEEMLSAYSFVKCNHWYMVNLKYVSEVRKNTVIVGGTELEISRRNRTQFLKALAEYVGGLG